MKASRFWRSSPLRGLKVKLGKDTTDDDDSGPAGLR
jgi:hypothetical protein